MASSRARSLAALHSQLWVADGQLSDYPGVRPIVINPGLAPARVIRNPKPVTGFGPSWSQMMRYFRVLGGHASLAALSGNGSRSFSSTAAFPLVR